MKRSATATLFSLFFAGCVSTPIADLNATAPDRPLAVGDCLVLEPEDKDQEPLRKTIDADEYFPAPMGLKVKIVGMTPTQARDLIASEYFERNLFHNVPHITLLRCDEFDRKQMQRNLKTTF